MREEASSFEKKKSKKKDVYVILSYCHNICFLSQCFFLRTCFAKSVLNSINLFQGFSEGLQFKRSYLGSSVIGYSLVSSVTRSSLGPWVIGMSHWVSKCALYYGKILSSIWMISETIICAPPHEKLRLRPSCCLAKEFEL